MSSETKNVPPSSLENSSVDRQSRLEALIREAIGSVSYFEIVDESAGHSRGRETHYRIHVVSEDFHGQSRVARQRGVMALFQQEFDQGLHSVSLRLQTPAENEEGASTFQTPKCSGKSS